MLKILKTPEGKKFLIAVACVFIVAVCVVSKAAFQGVEDQYNLPMDTWDTSLFIIQGRMGGHLQLYVHHCGGAAFRVLLSRP
ncbi:inner membrane protein [Klebsiella pneumoniae]|nr:inner membrane protein [Klebsiella pneumoniae]